MPSSAPSTFVALQHRNFRLLWVGQLISISGTMMQGAAILWHIALLAPPGWKALSLGLVGLARIGPILVFGLWSGVLADAVDRRRLMLVAQATMMLAATGLALVTASGHASPWNILLIAGFGAAAGAADGPARQALLPSLVPREHLPNAISLNSIVFQTASVVGPALAGVALATVGIAARLRAECAVVRRNDQRAPADARPAAGSPAGPPRHQREVARGGAPVRVRDSAAPGHDAARRRRDLLLLGDGAAAALRPGRALQVGPRGYGWLFAAPSIGAVIASAAMICSAGLIRRRRAHHVRWRSTASPRSPSDCRGRSGPCSRPSP